jgi:CRISPR type IV-associated protein Csf3
MQINAGASKAYLFPIEVGHLLGDEMVWYAEAIDVDELRELLSMCSHIGRRRAVGLGRVESWQVEECERWPGFPVLWEGAPLRPLPVDWPGLEPGAGWVLRRRLTYPYWCGPKEEVACPPRSM